MNNYTDRFGEDDPGRIGTRLMAENRAKHKINSSTSTRKLSDLIFKSDMVEITNAEYFYHPGMVYQPLNVDLFLKSLQTLSFARFFSETVKWKYKIDVKDDIPTVFVVGELSEKTVCTRVYVQLKLKTGITSEQVEKKLKETV